MQSNIDFLIVGAGLYGATIARILTNAGFKCLIFDKRNHVGGNIYSENIYGYEKHVYGPHIFHTDNKTVENFVKKYSEWNPYQLNTIAIDGDNIYHLPFNMHTFYDIFKIKSPAEVKSIIEKEIEHYGSDNPKNLEEQAINMVGKTVFDKLIKNYTEKQWGKSCKELSPNIIKRLPMRFEYNNNYFNDSFQAIPKNGYTQLIYNIIGDIPFICGCEFTKEYYDIWKDKVKLIIYCGAVDEFFDYEFGELQWRSLRFEDSEYVYNGFNGQGNAIINDVSTQSPTRYVEHMWFTPMNVHVGITSIISTEIPDEWDRTKEKYYPINNDITDNKYLDYCVQLSKTFPKIYLGGRLGKYRYFDMDDTILEAMNDSNYIIQRWST